MANPDRARLHEQSGGICFWCGMKTKLSFPNKNGNLPDHASTVDHLVNAKDRPHHLQGVIVNACHACNRKRGIESDTASAVQRKQHLKRDIGIYLLGGKNNINPAFVSVLNIQQRKTRSIK